MRILFIDIDTLRADHLHCYGYFRETSSNIDSIAKEGIRFDNYYCSDAPCLPSRSALFTGKFGIKTGVVGHGGTAADMRIEGKNREFKDKLAFTSLPAFLKNLGFHTVTISPFGERHSAWWFYSGFKEIYNTGKSGMETADDIIPIALNWLNENALKDNWFLHVNLWDPHTPYRTPKEFGNPFESSPISKWYTEELLQKHRQLAGPHTAQDLNMYDNYEDPRFPRQPGELKNMEDLKKLIDGYDTGIKYADFWIGKIVNLLKEKGIYEDTAIIVSSDHGESMGELGIYAEHATADYVTCRIPMIIKWPGGVKNQVHKGLLYNLDLIPTLYELLKDEKKEKIPEKYRKILEEIDGISYAKTITKAEDASREYLILSQMAHVCQRSVRFDDWIYIRTYHDGYHLFPKEMLFYLKEDPHEQINVAEENPEICGKALRYLNEWHDKMMSELPEGYQVDPMQTVLKEGGPYHARGQLKSYYYRLNATGREKAAEELKSKYPEEFLGENDNHEVFSKKRRK